MSVWSQSDLTNQTQCTFLSDCTTELKQELRLQAVHFKADVSENKVRTNMTLFYMEIKNPEAFFKV